LSFRQRLRLGSSWAVAVFGFLVGVLLLSFFGLTPVPVRDSTDPGWYLYFYTYVGVALFGIAFAIGSIIAVCKRRLAALIFLSFIPLASFCISYQDAGYLYWEERGGIFETPVPWLAITLGIVFFAPFATLLVAAKSRRISAYLGFGASVLVAVVVFATSHWTRALVPRLAGWSIPLLLPATFWYVSEKREWPILLLTAAEPRSWQRRLGRTAALCLVFLSLFVVVTFGLAVLKSSFWSRGDCNEKPLFARPIHHEQAVFTAHTIYVPRSENESGVWFGSWAIAVVKERFWGLPQWFPRVVLLVNYPFQGHKDYFIDGSRSPGLFARFLPIVPTNLCSRTNLVSNAPADLRLLRRPPQSGQTHLIGFVATPQSKTGAFSSVLPLENATLKLIGPTDTKILTTDKDGVYQIDGLAPGNYSLQLLLPADQIVLGHGEKEPLRIHLEENSIASAEFVVFWNGRISGRVTDEKGKAAHVMVTVSHPDGGAVLGYARSSVVTDQRGNYQLDRIPAGQYVVSVNPDGPSDESPYSKQFYPSASDIQNARVLELGDGQEVSGIDFMTPRIRK
jgi:hypothetical protein